MATTNKTQQAALEALRANGGKVIGSTGVRSFVEATGLEVVVSTWKALAAKGLVELVFDERSAYRAPLGRRTYVTFGYTVKAV